MRAIGIDPGMSGGVAFIDRAQGIAQAIPMPINKISTGKTSVDIWTLKKWLSVKWAVCTEQELIVVEHVHSMPKQGVKSTFTFGMGFGKILGLLESMNWPYILVDSRKWKNRVLAGTTKDKQAAIYYCQQNYPTTSLLATLRSKVPSDGLADALCLADYGCRVLADA